MRLLAFAAFASLAASTSAHALEPKKPSELVTLVPSVECQEADGLLYGNRLLADGSLTPFIVPPKQVLVVKRWSFAFTGGGPAASAHAILLADGALGGIARVYFPFDADGRGGGVVELDAVVGEGRTLCGFHTSGVVATAPSDVFIEGYLTKAK